MAYTKAGAVAEMQSYGNSQLFEMQLRRNPTPKNGCSVREWDIETMSLWRTFRERLDVIKTENAIKRAVEHFKLDLEEFIEAYEQL